MITRRLSIPIRIDFMPFVSVALLLIVFFIFRKMSQRPVIMGVTVPSGCRKYESSNYPKKVVTLFLLDKGEIGFMQYWRGDDMVELQQTAFGPDGLTKLLETVKKSADEDIAVIIKPNQLATFRNVDNALEVLKRVGIPYLPISELPNFEQRRVRYYEQMFIYRRIPRDTVFLQMQPYYCSLEEN